MAFSNMFREFESQMAKRVSTGPFGRFASLYEKYAEPAKKAENNVDVSNEMTKSQSSSKTDTTFNDSLSKSIREYNKNSGQLDSRVRAALAASPNMRVRRR